MPCIVWTTARWTYLRHLAKCDEILGARLNTIHNLYYYQDLMRGLRQAIEEQRLSELVKEFYDLRRTDPPGTTP